jgi:hypothetical protein
MSDETFKVQWSVSLPPVAQYAKGHMLNLRGQTVEEVNDLLDAVLDNDGTFLVKAIEVGSVLLVAQGLNSPDAAADPQETLRASGPVDTSHVCKHGKRDYKTGNGARGKWEGYFCPQPKGSPDQCAVEWVDNKR